MKILLRGGTVYSTHDPLATALLIEGGTVSFVGSDDAALTLSGGPDSLDEIVDLDGALVTPAFVDAHVHTTETGLLLDGVDVRHAGSVEEILDRVAAAGRRAVGRPILGYGWDERLLAERRPPTRAELDRAGAGAAVYLARVDVHSAVVSSALAAASDCHRHDGWTDDGRVERDAHHAARSATRELPPARRTDLQRLALRAAAARGIATVHEASAPYISDDDDLIGLVALARDPAERLPDVVAYRGTLVADADQAAAVRDAFGPWLAGLAGDLNADGSVGSRTAAFRQEYTDAPGSRGHAYLDAVQVRDHVVACTRTGLQAGFHVIGDAALDAVLDGFRAAAAIVGVPALRAARHRLEHLETPDAEAITTLADLAITASVQPAFDALWGGDGGLYAARLGTDRALAMNPFAAMAAAGVPLALGSDCPVTPFDPWGAVRACVHHHVQDQRMSAADAFAAHTRGGHRAARRDDGGELRPGAPATLAVWAAGAPDPRCLLTVRDGTVLHDAR